MLWFSFKLPIRQNWAIFLILLSECYYVAKTGITHYLPATLFAVGKDTKPRFFLQKKKTTLRKEVKKLCFQLKSFGFWLKYLSRPTFEDVGITPKIVRMVLHRCCGIHGTETSFEIFVKSSFGNPGRYVSII